MARKTNPQSLPLLRGEVAAMPRILYPNDEAAYLLGISVRTFEEYVKIGEIHPRHIGGRKLYHYKELERFASTNHASPFNREASAAVPVQSVPQSASEGSQHQAA
jgi:hypothetical protein